MAMYLRPKRGKQASANSVLSGTNKLKSGEVFFEVPNAGVGKGQGRLMMGDGTSDYNLLNAFLAFDMNNVQTFSNVTNSNSSAIDYNKLVINSMHPASPLAHNLNRIKQALLNINERVARLYTITNDLEDNYRIKRTGLLSLDVILGGGGNYTIAGAQFGGYASANLMDATGWPSGKNVLYPIIYNCQGKLQDYSQYRGLVQLTELSSSAANIYVFGPGTGVVMKVDFIVVYTEK